MKINRTLQNVLVTGALSGMRTNAGLLFTGLLARKMPGNYFSPSRIVKFFYNKKTVTALVVSGVAELVVDKLPSTPNRTDKRGLIARAAAGVVCGVTINKAAGKKPLQGALTGGIAAVAATYACFHLRKSLCKTTGIPDPIIGAAEDALAIAGGIALLKANKTIVS